MSVDIFDELQRRKDNSPDIPFLPVDPNLAANKNAARQKLATLAVSRFHLLCSDVMQELETRFPVVVQRYEEKFGSMDRGGASSGSSYQQNSMQRGQYDERPSRVSLFRVSANYILFSSSKTIMAVFQRFDSARVLIIATASLVWKQLACFSR